MALAYSKIIVFSYLSSVFTPIKFNSFAFCKKLLSEMGRKESKISDMISDVIRNAEKDILYCESILL